MLAFWLYTVLWSPILNKYTSFIAPVNYFTGLFRCYIRSVGHIFSRSRSRGDFEVVPFSSEVSSSMGAAAAAATTEDQFDALLELQTGGGTDDCGGVVELGDKNLRERLLKHRLLPGMVFGLETYLWERQDPPMVMFTTVVRASSPLWSSCSINLFC